MTSKGNTCMHYNDATIVKTPLLSTKSSSSWYYWNNFCNKKPWLHQVLMVMSKKSNRYVIQYCSTYARKEIFDSTAATSSASYTLHQLSLKNWREEEIIGFQFWVPSNQLTYWTWTKRWLWLLESWRTWMGSFLFQKILLSFFRAALGRKFLQEGLDCNQNNFTMKWFWIFW